MSWNKIPETAPLFSNEDRNRGYEMTIEPGGLYEVWLPFDDHPKLAVAIGIPAGLRGATEVWEVLVEDQLITQRGGRIFRIGTATPPYDVVEEMTMLISRQITHTEDQKFLRLLSAME